MLFLINDTGIQCFTVNVLSLSQGGTSSWLTDFICYLMQKKTPFGLIGDFRVEKERLDCYTFHSESSIEFRLKLFILFFRIKFSTYDILYFQRPDHLALAWRCKSKKVLHLHGQPYSTINSNRGSFIKYFYNFLESVAVKHANLIISTDKRTTEVYSSVYPLVKAKVKTIPIGINLSVFSPDNDLSIFPGIDKNIFNLVFIGRLAYPKRIKEIINAFNISFSDISPAHLWIGGSGPDEVNLKKLAKESLCSDYIHFTGFLNRAEVNSLINSSSAGIFISQNEGSPVAVKEFLACGKPVIVNDVGDLTDYIIDGVNGYIVTPGYPDSLVNAIKKIAVCGINMKEASRQSVFPYDYKKISKQVLDELLKVQSG